MQKRKVDMIIKDAQIVTMNCAHDVLYNAYIAIDGGNVVSIGGAELLDAFEALEVINASGLVAFPGLISTHAHLFQVLLRGLGRDKKLFDWLDSSVRRAVRRLDGKCCYYAAMTGCIEAIKTGTTTTLDFMYCHGFPGLDDYVTKAFEDIGIRGILGRARADFSTFPKEYACSYLETEQEFFDDTVRLTKKYKDHPRISTAVAPGIIWDLSDDGYRQVRAIANEYSIPITMHTLETEDDDIYCLKNRGNRTMVHLEKLGVLGKDFIAVHCVNMEKEDFELFEAYDVKVSHNPVSNMILASGVAPVLEFLKKGLTVSLAVDGAASNDAQSILEAMKSATLLQKVSRRDAEALPASTVIEMATVMGARALGMENTIGSIEVGKKADVVLYDFLQPNTTPTHDPVSAIVYNASSQNVNTSIIDGKIVLRNGKMVNIDEERILAKTQEAAKMLIQQTGLGNSQWGKPIRLL